jgi:GT2 family glycosyltransferase
MSSTSHRPEITHPTLRQLVSKNHIHGGTTLYRTTYHRIVGGWREDLPTGEEFEFHLRLLSRGAKIEYTDKVVFKYRIHGANKSTKHPRGSKYWNERARVIKEFRDEYRAML